MRSRIITIMIVTSLLAVGLFGIMGINMTGYNGRHSCPISALSGNNCSPSNSPLAEASHHISGLQNLAQGAISANAFSFMILTLLLSAFSILGIFFPKAPLPQISYQGYRGVVDFHPPKQQLLRWLALLQKRDPHALQWVHDYS